MWWLREYLQSLFPADVFPTLPKKKWVIVDLKMIIYKILYSLQKIIDEIINVEKYKPSETLKIYLSLDRNSFESSMKNMTPEYWINKVFPNLEGRHKRNFNEN